MRCRILCENYRAVRKQKLCCSTSIHRAVMCFYSTNQAATFHHSPTLLSDECLLIFQERLSVFPTTANLLQRSVTKYTNLRTKDLFSNTSYECLYHCVLNRFHQRIISFICCKVWIICFNFICALKQKSSLACSNHTKIIVAVSTGNCLIPDGL